MTNLILSLCASTLMMSAILISGCSTPAEKVENAQKDVTQANIDLDKANQAYEADIANYRAETDNKITANNKSIAEFNARIELEKQDARAEYRKKIVALEQKNSDMKKKMDDYKMTGKENWEIFKTEFSHDMDELGKAFSGFTTNSK
jgi:septal ring factor EnvC (AmiA/AmiB activator)